jgi:hypothetical protein
MVVETSRQPVALESTTGSSMAVRIWRTIMGAAQPAQSRCPGVKRSSFLYNSFSFSGVAIFISLFTDAKISGELFDLSGLGDVYEVSEYAFYLGRGGISPSQAKDIVHHFGWYIIYLASSG